MQEPPLSRPRLEPVHDRVEGHYDLQEVSKGRDGGLHAVSVGDQGLGVQQLYRRLVLRLPAPSGDC